MLTRIASNPDFSDPHTGLAIANCHALILFHCRNFTFHSCWRNKPIPSLHRFETQEHVDAILELSDKTLRSSEIPGALLLFPLRNAGANVLEYHKQREIINLLDRIFQMGFVVAQIIKADLEEFWHHEVPKGNFFS